MQILLVEDHTINQLVTHGMLARLGFKATLAETGREALHILQLQRNFDLILMDIQMPVMGGIETTQQIRTLYPDWHVPILALTANAVKGDEAEYLGAGMDACLTKPVQMGNLHAAIAHWCPAALEATVLS